MDDKIEDFNFNCSRDAALISIAISLKRIADMMEDDRRLTMEEYEKLKELAKDG